MEKPANSAGKPYDIRIRTFEFGLDILDISGRLPHTPEAHVVRTQLARAGTSVGANTEEADGAVSRPDKRKSLITARKEARETRYWLRVVDRKWGAIVPVSSQIQEATEILLILSAIIDKLS